MSPHNKSRQSTKEMLFFLLDKWSDLNLFIFRLCLEFGKPPHCSVEVLSIVALAMFAIISILQAWMGWSVLGAYRDALMECYCFLLFPCFVFPRFGHRSGAMVSCGDENLFHPASLRGFCTRACCCCCCCCCFLDTFWQMIAIDSKAKGLSLSTFVKAVGSV